MPTILIVDDSENALLIAHDVLLSEGYSVATCLNPENDLLKMLGDTQVENGGIDLILMDVTMPGKSGDQWVKELKQGDYGARVKKVKMVLYSSLPEENLDQLASQSNADGYILKRDIFTLIKGVKKYVGNNQPTSE